MRGAGMLDHWMEQTPLQLEPVVGSLLQIGDGILAKKIRCDRFAGCFARQPLDAILAKFKHMWIFIGARPSTALAREARPLVDLEPISNAAAQARLPGSEFQTLRHRPHPRRDAIGWM